MGLNGGPSGIGESTRTLGRRATRRPQSFYVYILKLEDGSFYAGQTREIRERLMEHRDGMTKSTEGKDPKLVWFTTVTTREQATDYEVQVK